MVHCLSICSLRKSNSRPALMDLVSTKEVPAWHLLRFRQMVRNCMKRVRPQYVQGLVRVGWLAVLTAIVTLTACSQTQPTPGPLSAVTSHSGRGAVVGTLIDQRTSKPAAGTILYLEPTSEDQVPS